MAEGNNNNINTVNTEVEFPLDELFFPTVSNVQEQLAVVDLLYNLIGTLNYKTKCKGGHYTAITNKANLSHCYDDDLVSTIRFRFRKENKTKIEFQRIATILFYCRYRTQNIIHFN